MKTVRSVPKRKQVSQHGGVTSAERNRQRRREIEEKRAAKRAERAAESAKMMETRAENVKAKVSEGVKASSGNAADEVTCRESERASAGRKKE